MFYVRTRATGEYVYYLTCKSCSTTNKLKDAIGFEDLETAQVMKNYCEQRRKEKLEVVSVITQLTVIEDQNEQEKETVDLNEN